VSATPLRLAVIVASTREGRFGPTVAAWFAGEAGRRTDLDVEIVDLATPEGTPEGTPEAGTKAGTETGTRAGTETGTKAGNKAGNKAGTETGTETGTRAGTETGTKAATNAMADPTAKIEANAWTGAKTDTGSVTGKLGAADAFVVVTPEYNHSYPAPLKAVIDSHFREWHAKPVGFVSYGGLSGGLRAVEHLRVVFAELHAVTVRDTVSFHGARSCFGPDGRPLDEAVPGAAAGVLLDRLTWWGLTLRDAHQARPYVTA